MLKLWVCKDEYNSPLCQGTHGQVVRKTPKQANSAVTGVPTWDRTWRMTPNMGIEGAGWEEEGSWRKKTAECAEGTKQKSRSRNRSFLRVFNEALT